MITVPTTSPIAKLITQSGVALRSTSRVPAPMASAVPYAPATSTNGSAIGAGSMDVDLAEATPTWITNLLISGIIGTLFIVGEEIGWRGYLLPRFQQLTSKRKAAVTTGFVHGCFHLPLILLATTYDTGSAKWFAAPMAVAVITAGGVFYAWLWDRCHTVWPVAIAHNVVNTVFDLGAAGVVATAGWNMAYVAGETGFATLGACVVAAVVLLKRARVWREADVEQKAGQPSEPLVAA